MARRATIDFGGFAWPSRTAPSHTSEVPAPPATVAVLRFALPRAGQAAVIVHDARGNLVRTLLAGELAAGEHACGWDGCDERHVPAPAGEYTLRLEVDDQLVTSRRVSIGGRS
jgi:hypothetical protein